jgi:hypothetical protein
MKRKKRVLLKEKRDFLHIGGFKESDSRDQVLQKHKDCHACICCDSEKGIKLTKIDDVEDILERDDECQTRALLEKSGQKYQCSESYTTKV